MTAITLDSIEQEIFFKDADGRYVSVRYDPYPENPLTFYDSLGTYLTWENRHISPSDNPYRTAIDFMETVLGEEKAAACDSMQDVLQALDKAGYAACGIYRYEHGQVSYALGEMNPYGDYWDSGAVGFAFVSPEKLAYEGMSKEQAISYMKNEIKEYSAWANSDVYLAERYDEKGISMEMSTFYGFNELVAEYPDVEPIDLGDFSDLREYLANEALTNELEGEWFFQYSDQWHRAAYIKEPMAIVSGEVRDSWRIVDIKTNQVSFGTFETPQDALFAIKQHQGMSKEELRSFIPPKNVVERPLEELKKEAKERASEKSIGRFIKNQKSNELGL